MAATGTAAEDLGAEVLVAVFAADGDDLVQVIDHGRAEGEVVVAVDPVDAGVAEIARGLDGTGLDALCPGGRGYGEKYKGSAEALECAAHFGLTFHCIADCVAVCCPLGLGL